MTKDKKQEEARYNNAPLTREDIKSFEKELEDYKNSHRKSPNPDYYGTVLTTKSGKEFIANKILGKCEWWEVAYCLNNKIISHRQDGLWRIVSETAYNSYNPPSTTRVEAWGQFAPKWRALQELREKRRYAEEKDKESIQSLLMK
ncbi:MAG: hypothetical protein KGJ58_04680 [Patescibacteria group bacterium]|nr:hypothetical protein [Patescibacteria group bacterium]